VVHVAADESGGRATGSGSGADGSSGDGGRSGGQTTTFLGGSTVFGCRVKEKGNGFGDQERCRSMMEFRA
jgi:hypothetical protein